MGKNWARGLTARTDPRVARNADARRGRKRGPYKASSGNDRRRTSGSPRFIPPATDDDWTAALAYAVGLAVTDGCLSSNGKTVAQTSADRDSLETFRRCIGSTAPIGRNGDALRVQVCDVGFYRWLASLGLTPRKSLTIGGVYVPDRYFTDLLRGLLDGDGSIIVSTVVPNPQRYPNHTYERLRVQFHTASERHATWLRAEIQRLLKLTGWLGAKQNDSGNPLYVVRYSKHDSITLLTALYADPQAPRLERKWRIWVRYRDQRKPTRKWHRRRAT